MEFSVRFFKRLILAVLALLILIPTVLALWFGCASGQLSRQNALLTEQLQKTQAQLAAQVEGGGAPLQETAPGTDFTYQTMYPQLRVDGGGTQAFLPGMVYLTFDGGPSEGTISLLEALDMAGVKATFFVSGRDGGAEAQARIKEIVDRGHSLGVLPYSEDYHTMYASVEQFLEAFNAAFELIYEATGVPPVMFRFPGGSVNSYNTGTYQQIIAEMLQRGFVFYDWNVIGVDNVRGATADSVVQTVLADMTDKSTAKERAIVELHDSGSNTAVAVPKIVEELQAKGWTFAALTPEVLPMVFRYKFNG